MASSPYLVPVAQLLRDVPSRAEVAFEALFDEPHEFAPRGEQEEADDDRRGEHHEHDGIVYGKIDDAEAGDRDRQRHDLLDQELLHRIDSGHRFWSSSRALVVSLHRHRPAPEASEVSCSASARWRGSQYGSS